MYFILKSRIIIIGYALIIIIIIINSRCWS